VLNNLEFDHADIFDDLAAIKRQFSHLLRVVPDSGQVIYPTEDKALNEVVDGGCWSDKVQLGKDWSAKRNNEDGTSFEVMYEGDTVATVEWSLLGEHNVNNAMMAIIAARHVGVPAEQSADSLSRFQSPKRRMELIGEHNRIRVYDDFAHHPSAIKTTLRGLRSHLPGSRIVAVLEPRSNTMKMGVHADAMEEALRAADEVFVLQPDGLKWELALVLPNAHVFTSTGQLLEGLLHEAQPEDSVVIMSNGSFDGLHQRFLSALQHSQEA
jgi:UDP-N-acetylmuramate: L-alanyl-gamma-D-glutamyl-meso-diaminopimelate ligase